MASNPGGTFDLQVDPAEADRRKRTRLVQLNTQVIPRLRLLGFAFVAACALLHNAFIYPGLGFFSWAAWLRLVGILGAYSLVSWYVLYLFYEETRASVDLGVIFLALDMSMFSVAIYFTGAQHSWIFVLPLFRVVDQTTTSFRRALAFAHLAPLSYAFVILHVVLVRGQDVAVPTEIAKVVLIYVGSLYISMIARTGDERHARSSAIIRLARELIHELEEKSNALERSSRQLHDLLDQQADLHKENARLFTATEAREARLSQILHSTSDGIIFVGPDGRIEAANVRAGDLLEFDPQTVIGMDVMRIVARLYSLGDGDTFGVTLKALLADPGPGAHGDLQQPATGRVFHWVAQPTRDNRGSTVGLTFTFQDVTPTRDLVRQLEDKSRLLEDARRKAEEANRAKGEFLANVTHEVRTPLSAIIGMATVLVDPPPNVESLTMIRRIKIAAESLLAIIGDILDFSKIDSRKLVLSREPLPLRAALQEVLDTVQVTAEEKGLELVLDVLPEVPDGLIGDALRLRQVLVNLVGNAIKFTQTGEIRLRVDVASPLPDEVCLHFAVIDTGIGIPRDKQELVFEAFAQADGTSARRFGGTGLGLSISARLVELMGGDIWVESEVGRGSAFRFTANFGLQGAVEPPAPDVMHEAIRAVTVLVAEDEQVHRELVAHLLRSRGHHVVTAWNGREALVELARHPVQIVLLDLQMPEMDGLQLAAAIRTWERSQDGHLPLVAMTASVMARDLDQCHAAGIDEVLIKPIARDRLFRMVESLATDTEPSVLPPPELAGRAAFLEALGNDLNLARRLIDLFLQDSGRLMEDIRRAIDERDTDALRRTAHTLKGSVSNFPAGAARDTAARMEAIGFDGDYDAAEEVFPILEQEIERLRGLLPTLI
jgi:signal transduction histidine kinase/CheY-like chemotaxis protein/HPt (histidine-containing phosphotransfer) domain-containing protein